MKDTVHAATLSLVQRRRCHGSLRWWLLGGSLSGILLSLVGSLSDSVQKSFIEHESPQSNSSCHSASCPPAWLGPWLSENFPRLSPEVPGVPPLCPRQVPSAQLYPPGLSPKQLLSLPDGPFHPLHPFLLSLRLSEVLLTTPSVHSTPTELELNLGLLPTQTFISEVVKRTYSRFRSTCICWAPNCLYHFHEFSHWAFTNFSKPPREVSSIHVS